ncbi:MAG TPA: hydrogenase iron-sulfur subunit [Planctomycetota bacterium]|jgi:coenzyme F420-reducing hydrogenase delta subunit
MSEQATQTTEQPATGTEAGATAGQKTWQPKVVAFVCNWCTYAGADLAGTSRLQYDANIRVLRLPCTGRIDPLFIIKAFERGADGVLVSGCHPGDCHYNTGNYHARRRWMLFRPLLEYLGIDPKRVQFSWVSAAEGAKWAAVVNDTVKNVREMGPFEGYHAMLKESGWTE